MMKKAVFLDRDGVINSLVYNPLTNEYESPHYVDDLYVYPWVIKSLHSLAQMNLLLFLVSNQPSYAKGKTSLENIKAIHERLHQLLVSSNIKFTEYYYCYHHPAGIISEYAAACRCRKPKPYFLLEAQKKYSLDLPASWMIGDQDTDITCGQAAGVKTIQIRNEHSAPKRGMSNPDFSSQNLETAVQIIIEESKK